MTKFNLTAESNGEKFEINFDVNKDMTRPEWDNITKLLKMALSNIK